MKNSSMVFIVYLLAATLLNAQTWQVEPEISFRIDVARPVAAAMGADGGLVVADGQTLALHFIHPVTGKDRVLAPPEQGWASIKDFVVLCDSTVVILDSHNSRTWRLDPAGHVQSVSPWRLPFSLYQAEILLAGQWGEWVRLRQTRIGRAGPRQMFIRKMSGQGRERIRLGPFPDGALSRRVSGAGLERLHDCPGALHDCWAAHPQSASLFHVHGRSGEVSVHNIDGTLQYRFQTGLAMRPIDAASRQYFNETAGSDVLPDSLPAVRKLAVDGMGQLWLMTGERRLERGRWHECIRLYESGGAILGEMWIDFEPAVFFMDRVFTLRQDTVRGQTVVRRYRSFPVVAHIP